MVKVRRAMGADKGLRPLLGNDLGVQKEDECG